MLHRPLLNGDQFKVTIVEAVNGLLDFCTRSHLIAGRGIALDRTPGGTVIRSTSAAGPGAQAFSPSYDGMFAVRENDDGTVTVNGGFVDLTPIGPNAPREIAGSTLQKPEVEYPTSQLFVLLTARYVLGLWQLAFEISTDGRLYTPGELISWPLARLSSPGKEFVQLWQNGMINFSDRYYLS